MEKDDRVGIVEKYLDELLPDNWDGLSMADRQYYFNKEFDTTKIDEWALNKVGAENNYDVHELRELLFKDHN